MIIFHNDDKNEQEKRIIMDNLARKNVDFETQFKCYQELKRLYGLKHGEYGKLQEKTKSGKFAPKDSAESNGNIPIMTEEEIAKKTGLNKNTFHRAQKIPSADRIITNNPIMTEEEIAKKTGLNKDTFHRAQKIQESTLPKEIKEAVFEGYLAVRPIAELLDKPEQIQQKVCKTIVADLQHNPNKKIAVTKIIRSVENEDTKRLMTDNIKKASSQHKHPRTFLL